MIDSKIPGGPLNDKWTNYKGHCKLVNPANKRKLEIIVVGTGLAGASAAASLGELGYKVKAFCFQRSDRDVTSVTSHAIEPLRSSEYFSFVFFRRVTPVAIKMSLYGALHLGRKPSLSFLCNGLHPLQPIFGSYGATLGSTHHSLLISEYSSSLVIT